jgi:hypothetical protein
MGKEKGKVFNKRPIPITPIKSRGIIGH